MTHGTTPLAAPFSKKVGTEILCSYCNSFSFLFYSILAGVST